ncbi:MAG: DNA-binding protein [Thermoprotei archaeon]
MSYTGSGGGDEYDTELEELKRRQVARLQQRAASEEAEAEAEAEEGRRQAVLRRVLTPEARQRLQNVKMVRYELARVLEDQIIALYQSGRIDRPITDEALKQLLARISASNTRDTSITIRRKGEV